MIKIIKNKVFEVAATERTTQIDECAVRSSLLNPTYEDALNHFQGVF